MGYITDVESPAVAEVEEMLRRGLFDCIIAEDKATALNFFDADIDTILKNNTRSVCATGLSYI